MMARTMAVHTAAQLGKCQLQQSWLIRLADLVIDWAERARERRFLAELDDRALHDIGLSRSDAEREAAKPFWR
jgi:uncharacterized protein YjiS (DUF1127 family)